MPPALKCGRFTEAGIHKTCKQRWKAKDTTSKTRTVAVGRALCGIKSEKWKT